MQVVITMADIDKLGLRVVNVEKQCTILYFYLGGGNNTVSSCFKPWLSFQMSHSTQINAFVWVETY